MMSDAELDKLGADIKRHGLQQDLAFWEGFLIDGRNRLQAMERAGIELLPLHRSQADTDDPYAYVISANIQRRHLTAEQKRDLIAKLIEAQPEKSDRAIAATVKASHHTVARVRDEAEANGQIAHNAERQEASGRKARGRKPGSGKVSELNPTVAPDGQLWVKPDDGTPMPAGLDGVVAWFTTLSGDMQCDVLATLHKIHAPHHANAPKPPVWGGNDWPKPETVGSVSLLITQKQNTGSGIPRMRSGT
jgi:hypothetical protein